MDAGVVGFDLKRFFEMNDRLLWVARKEQYLSQIVIGTGIVGFDLQRLLEMSDRFVPLSCLKQRDAEVVMG